MSAALFDLSVLHNDNFVGIFDCTEPVGNDNHRLFLGSDELIESFLHLGFALSIESRSSLVE